MWNTHDYKVLVLNLQIKHFLNLHNSTFVLATPIQRNPPSASTFAWIKHPLRTEEN